MAKTKGSTLQLDPLPEICDREWIKARYSISQRHLEQLVEKGMLKYFKPGRRNWRFHTYEVIAAFEGPEVAKSRRYIPAPNPRQYISREPLYKPRPLRSPKGNGQQPVPSDDDDVIEIEPDEVDA
jgi:hypothetical protein